MHQPRGRSPYRRPFRPAYDVRTAPIHVNTMSSSRKRSQEGSHERAPVLVVGGAGYVGSHVAKCLWHAGFQPLVFDDLSSGNAEAVRWGPLLKGNCIDSSAVQAVLEKHRCAVVIYCAGPAPAGSSKHAVEHYLDTGVQCAHSVLSAMHRAQARALIHLSTYEVYGAPAVVPVKERAAAGPQTPWGKLSRHVETLLSLASMDSPVTYVSLRLANVCGADADGELQEPVDDDGRFIAHAALSAAGLAGPVRYHGDAHPTQDGTIVRDYVSVVDVGHAVVRAVLYLLCGGANAVINVGSGKGCSELEILRMVREISARDVPTRIEASDDQPPAVVADISRAIQLLHWSPDNSSPEQLVRSAWAVALNTCTRAIRTD